MGRFRDQGSVRWLTGLEVDFESDIISSTVTYPLPSQKSGQNEVVRTRRSEDARIFTEEAERNGKLPTPKLSESQRKILSTMLDSARNIIFPPRKD